MTRDNYQATRNLSKAHGADIWPPYKDLVHWRNQNACPHDITAISRDEAVASWQEVVDHQWKYRLETPTPTPDNKNLQTEVFSWVERGYKLIADWKYGLDGAGLFKGSNFSDPTRHRGSNNLVTTCTIPVQLVAEKDMGTYVLTEIIWQNSMVNSPYATCPLRMAFEAESHANIILERDRLMAEKNSLRPTTIRLFDTQVTIHHRLSPTMNDGKVKSVWAETHGMMKCTVCGANPTQMGSPIGELHDFVPRVDFDVLPFGPGNLHNILRAFDWINKYYKYKDIMRWSVM